MKNSLRNRHPTPTPTPPIRKGHLIPQNIRKRRIPILPLKRRGPKQHLINQNPQRPPIHRTRMSTTLNHLGSDILFRADERVGAEIRDARFGVDGGEGGGGWVGGDAAESAVEFGRVGVVVRGGAVAAAVGGGGGEDHGGRAARVGLFGQIEVGEHYVAGLVEEDVW